MSRTRKAIITASFGYTQYALAMVSGILLIPLILNRVETRTYGLWLATGELLAYAAVLDLGVFGVLPWMIAEADGRKDRDGLRSLITRGLIIGICVGVAFILLFGLLWWFVPGLLKFTDADKINLKGPLMLLALGTLLVYPMRIFNAVLIGLQDAAFNGVLTVIQMTLSIVLTLGLLLKGYGLYALASAAVFPQILTMLASLLRVRLLAPDLFDGWRLPRLTSVRQLFSQSIGVWLGGYGWQLVAASSGLVISYLGHPEWVPIYVCTARLSQMLLQMSWILPDSGLVGLAQLHGEGKNDRVRYIIGTMLRLHLLLAGAAACVILSLNPLFVRSWVGVNFFGGFTLNALLAFGLIWLSLIHGLVCAISVIGNRLRVGMITMINGLLHITLAVILGSYWDLKGIVAATILSSTMTALPLGLLLLKRAVGLNWLWMLKTVCWPWAVRALPLIAIASVIGIYYGSIGLSITIVLAALLGIVFLWWMRPMYETLPIDPRFRRLLVAFRLLPGKGEEAAPTVS